VWQPGQTPNHTYTHCVMDAADDCVASTLTQGDAVLIAAAADLLEACKAFIDAPRAEHLVTRLNDAEMDAVRAMKAAIAKAEGGGE